MIGFRPCGACRALVPAEAGCGHWQPGRSQRVKAALSRARRRAEAEKTEALRRMLTPR